MDQSLLESKEGRYYGKNDFRPLSGAKKCCAWAALIICSPMLVLWGIAIYLIPFCPCIKFSNSQIQTLKALLFDYWFKAPGKKFEVKPSDEKDTSDIIISQELVDDKGYLHTCGKLGISLRKSLEHTVDQHLRAGQYGKAIVADTDVSKPRYFLNGSTYPYDPKYGEVWCSSGRLCHWPPIYCWSPNLPAGLSFSSLHQKVNTKDLSDVLGYIYLFEATNYKKYYETDRIVRVGQGAMNSPTITPENEGKIFARYNYRDSYYFGNIKTDGSEPDAYIFKGKTLQEAGLTLRHTYRVMKPAAV